jgi:hypothetical protein
MSGIEAIGFPIGRYRLRFELQAAGDGAYQGSAWRGTFRRALKRMVCVTRLANCHVCILNRNRIYPQLFESPLPPAARKMRRYDTVSHPFAIAPLTSSTGRGDEHVELSVTLFGGANQHLPYVIHALRQAGENGIGRRRVQHSLVALEQTTCLDREWRRIYLPDGALTSLSPVTPTILQPPKSMKVRLQSPLRIKHAGHLRAADAFSFAGFFVNLLRRISRLTYFYTDTALDVDFKSLTETARAFPVTQSTTVARTDEILRTPADHDADGRTHWRVRSAPRRQACRLRQRPSCRSSSASSNPRLSPQAS